MFVGYTISSSAIRFDDSTKFCRTATRAVRVGRVLSSTRIAVCKVLRDFTSADTTHKFHYLDVCEILF